MRIYWPLSGQLSLLRRLAASVFLVWSKAELAIRLSRTILHDALNEWSLVFYVAISIAAPQVYN